MKTILQVLAIISILISTFEVYKGTVDRAILFLIWSFYLKYLSDKIIKIQNGN